MPTQSSPGAAWRRALEQHALELGRAAGELLVEAWRILRGAPWLTLVAAAGLVGLWFLSHPWDHVVDDAVKADGEAHSALATQVRKFGAFIDICVWTAAMLALGWVCRRARWRRAAVACFIAACLAGLTANIARFSTGRARPRTELPDGFTGPSLHYEHQSFPSGHTSTSAGGAVALVVVFPPLGVLAVGEAIAVGWACSYCRAHWLSDLAVSGGLGLSYGILIGVAHWRCEQRRMAAAPPGLAT